MHETAFDLWLKGCEKARTILYCLEGEGDTALYKTQTAYIQKHTTYYTTPVYHVWIKGRCKLATESYRNAYSKWSEETC